MQLPGAVAAVARPIPIRLVQHVTRSVYRRVMARHPRLFNRLGEHAGKTFVFAPTDLPFAFAVTPRNGRVLVSRSSGFVSADVAISGPMVMLLALLEGRVDGDAEFFARQLTIDGDMEAVLALRNALDDNAIDLPTDLAASAGPLARPLRRVLERLRHDTLAFARNRPWN